MINPTIAPATKPTTVHIPGTAEPIAEHIALVNAIVAHTEAKPTAVSTRASETTRNG